MKNQATKTLSIYKSKLKNIFFKEDYSYIYADNYLTGEKRIVPGNINFNSLTQLCELMMKKGSDKGGFVGRSRHNYTPLYYRIFKKWENQNINFFELGIGTTNTDLASNMGETGTPGASLKGWKDFFKKAEIFAADIDRNILFQEDRIRTYYCDQTSPADISAMWNEIGLNNKFEVIFDDGLHEFHANVIFFENSIQRLKDNGIFIIEDVLENTLEEWISYLNNYAINTMDIRFSIIKIPNPHNLHDNNLIVIGKKSN